MKAFFLFRNFIGIYPFPNDGIRSVKVRTVCRRLARAHGNDWARAGSSPRRRPHRLRDWNYPDRWPGHGGAKGGAEIVACHVAKARTRVDGNQRADRVRSEQFKPAQATERVDEDRELRPRRRTEAQREGQIRTMQGKSSK